MESLKNCMKCQKAFPRDISGSEYCKTCRKPMVEQIAKDCKLYSSNFCLTNCKWREDCPKVISIE